MNRDITAADMLRSAARRFPDKTAYVFAKRSCTWRELDQRVDRLAHALQARGVKPGDVIASCSHDGPILMEVLFAASRIGAIRVGLNYRLAPTEVRSILEHCKAKMAFVQKDFLPLVAGVTGTEIVSAGDGQIECAEFDTLLASGDGSRARECAHPVAQICYTTGSTGAPKGAIWSHQSIAASMAHTLLDLDFKRDDVWLHAFPGAGVPCLLALWNVVQGMTAIVMPFFEAENCLNLIETHQVSRLILVPTMLAACCDAQERRARQLATVNCISYGSAPTPPALIKRAMRLFPRASLEQWYGSTEGVGGWFTTLTPQAHRDGLDSNPRLLESCGQALHHCRIRVIDDEGKDCAAGEVGEVLVAGPFLMDGYLNAPELTQKVMENGWLRTGDMGQLDADGFLYLVDRKQFMIISGGYNVYPVEVENVLAAHPAVDEVCVFGVPDERWGEAVCAVVVLREAAVATADELVEWSRPQLAKFKLPKQIEFRKSIARGATGKILKRAERDRYLRDSAERQQAPVDTRAGQTAPA